MIITDTLSNLFSKIKNGYLSKKSKITQQNSKQCINILNILVREGFIKSYKIRFITFYNRKIKTVVFEMIRIPNQKLKTLTFSLNYKSKICQSK